MNSRNNNLIDQAADPEQYTSGRATTWIVDDKRQSDQREKFWNAIENCIPANCTSLLDIGCGSGWTSKKFSKLGASHWTGLEPSSKSYEIAKKNHPSSDILNTTFEKYSTESTFDCILAIMVFSHVRDVLQVFNKVQGLLNSGGVLVIIFSAFHEGQDRFERNGRTYEVDEIDHDQYVDKAVVGAYGIADINRRPQYYIDRAVGAGLILVDHSNVADAGYSPKELLVFRKK